MRRSRSFAIGAMVSLVVMLASLPSLAHHGEQHDHAVRARRARWPVIVAAGDIAAAGAPAHGQQRTTTLIRRLRPTAVLPLGDTQYEEGLIGDYRSSYARTWGRFLHKTHPVPGNHEYRSHARGYFRYFGKRAHRSHGGYYSFDLGRWHLIALNSADGEGPSFAQLAWLRRDLERNRDRCELAYWHHPRFSSGVVHGSNHAMGSFWRILQAAGVDVVLNGHEHNYERFRPMLPGGRPSAGGIRQFVAGTGGKGGNYPFRSHPMRASQVRLNGLGLIRMELRGASYAWRFVRPGGRVVDRGSTSCHA